MRELKIFYYFIGIFIFNPIFEWGIHYLLHLISFRNHKLHHLSFHKNEIKVEKWPFITLCILIYLNWHILIIGNIRYYIIHTIIHKCPDICNGYFKIYQKQHIIHHKYPEYNFGVSSIWVDKLFNTNYTNKS